VLVLQVPVPSHEKVLNCEPDPHVGEPQTVPEVHNRQTPFAPQLPEVPHVFWALFAQSFCGSVLYAIGPHSPFTPPPLSWALQAKHVPEQALLQQKPSTQNPLEHCPAFWHVCPDCPLLSHVWEVRLQ